MKRWTQIARREQRLTAWLDRIDDPDERTFWWVALISMRVYFADASVIERLVLNPAEPRRCS